MIHLLCGLSLAIAGCRHRYDGNGSGLPIARPTTERYGPIKKTENEPASRPDDDNPEWTSEDFTQARPALDVLADVFGPEAAETVRRGRGQPPKDDRKVNQTLHLDADVLEAYRREGAGWQTRINQILREHMPERPK